MSYRRTRNSKVLIVRNGRSIVGVAGTFPEQIRAEEEAARFERAGFDAEMVELSNGPELRKTLRERFGPR